VLRSALVAVAILGAIGSGAFALQAAGLGKPSPAELDLTQTLHSLNEYTVSHATIALYGRSYRTTCRDSWIGDAHVSDVDIGGRAPILAVKGRIVDDTPLRWATFQLAGCPLRLSKKVAQQLIDGGSMATSAGTRLGRPVYILRSPQRRPQFEVVISQKTKLPLELGLFGRLRGTSLLTYGTLR